MWRVLSKTLAYNMVTISHGKTNRSFCATWNYFFPVLIRDYGHLKATVHSYVNRQRNAHLLRSCSALYLYLPLRKRPCFVTRRYLVSFTQCRMI
jgi:hypothetical protein